MTRRFGQIAPPPSSPPQPGRVPRRALAQTLSDLAVDLLEMSAGSPGRVTSVEMRLPIDLRLAAGGALLGDLPLFRRATAFDAPPTGLAFTLSEVPA